MFPLVSNQVQTDILLQVLALPLLGMLVMGALPKRFADKAAMIALSISLIITVASLRMVQLFEVSLSSFQFAFRKPLINSLGVTFSLGADGLSVWCIVFTTILMNVAMYRAGVIKEARERYFALLFLLEFAVIGTFLALDLVLFYFFWELMMIPNFLLLYRWGVFDHKRAAYKYALYTSVGSLLMLVSIAGLGIYGNFEGSTFFLGDLTGLSLNLQVEDTLFLGFLAAFFFKSAVFPFHTWLPDAHRASPEGGSFDLALLLPKMGLFGAMRFLVLIFPAALTRFQDVLIAVGVFSCLYSALVAWKQTDLKKFLAYATISHVGMAVAAFASLTRTGMVGALFMLLGSGLSLGGLFLLVSSLEKKVGVRSVSDLGGLASVIPITSALFLVFGLSLIGLPMTHGFIGEFFSIAGIFESNVVWGMLSSLAVVLSAIYFLSLYRRVFFGELKLKLQEFSQEDLCVMLPLVLLIFIIGLFPSPIISGAHQSLGIIEKVVPQLISSAAHISEERPGQISAQQKLETQP